MENKEEFIGKWKVEDGDELKKYRAREFIKIIENGTTLEKFDIDLYFKMIEKMIVYEIEKIIVCFLDWH